MTAREAALAALERCRRDKAWSNASIDNVIRKYELDRRDAALASRLCLGVLQNRTLCDFYIDGLCSTKLEPKVRDILRMGIYQLLFLDRIPERAAVNESVRLCKKVGYARASGLVNAVLRRVSLGDLPEIPGKGSAEYLAIRYSHPRWLSERLIATRGYDFTEAFFSADNTPPGICIQVNTLKTDVRDYTSALERAGVEYLTFDTPCGCIELSGGNVTELPGFEEGLFYVQDRAARTAVEIAAPEPGMYVLDACAAPGGKSFAAAIGMNNEGHILSCDIHEKKLSLIRGGAERLGIEIIDTASSDARAFDESRAEKYDLVIADVPCSGMGVIRKKPEIREKTEQEIAALPRIQSDILRNLSRYVRPGGTLLYSTCTVLAEENEAVVRGFLSENKSFEPEPFEVNGIKAVDGMYTFWPNVDATDGFFAAKMRRKN